MPLGRVDTRVKCFMKAPRSVRISNSTELAWVRQAGNANCGLTEWDQVWPLYKRRLECFGIGFALVEKVTIGTLDDYCDKNQIECIDLPEVDVEGHEVDVVRGAALSLAVATSIRGWGLYRMTPSAYLMSIEKCEEIYEQFRPRNFLVLRRDKSCS